MCAGKSRLGRLAAERLGWPLADSDKLLEERLGEPIASFFDREGEEAFRDREQELVLELLAAPGPAIVPLGGGALERGPVRDALAGHDVVHVEVGLDTAWNRAQRLRPPAGARPRALRPAARRPAPAVRVGGRRGAGRRRREDAGVRGRAARGPGRGDLRMIWAAQGYPVWVGAGAVDAAGELLADRGRCFVVADERVLAAPRRAARGPGRRHADRAVR